MGAMSIGPQTSGTGNTAINDPDNPYLQPGPAYVAPAPPPPPPPPPPAPPPEAVGHETSFESIVAQQLATDYPDTNYGDTTPDPPAPTADEYFFAGGSPVRQSQGPPPSVDQGFTLDQAQQEVQQQVTSVIGPAPALGDQSGSASGIGSAWYQSPESYQQQLGWLQAEAEKAMAAGDSVITDGNGAGLTGTAYLQQLQDEAQRVNAAYDDYGTRLSAWQEHANTLLPHVLPDIIASVQQQMQQANQRPLTPQEIIALSGPSNDLYHLGQAKLQQDAQRTYDQSRQDAMGRGVAEFNRDQAYMQGYGEQAKGYQDWLAYRDQQIGGTYFGPRGGDTVRVDPITGTHYDANGQPIAPQLGPVGPSVFQSAVGALGQTIGAGIDFFGHMPLFTAPVPGSSGGPTAGPQVTLGDVTRAGVTPFVAPAAAAATFSPTIPGLGAIPSAASAASTVAASPIFTEPAKRASLVAAEFEQPGFAALGKVAGAIGTALPSDLGGSGDLRGAISGLRDVPSLLAKSNPALITPSGSIRAADAVLLGDDPKSQAYLADHPFIAVGDQFLLDPWNLAGPHLLFEFAPATAKAGEFAHLALVSRAKYAVLSGRVNRSLKDLIAAGEISQEELKVIASLNPTWRDATAVRWSEAQLTQRYADFAVPQEIRDAGYADTFTKRVAALLPYNLRLAGSKASGIQILKQTMTAEAERILTTVRAELGAKSAQQMEQLLGRITATRAADDATLVAMLGVGTTTPSEVPYFSNPSFRKVYDEPVVSRFEKPSATRILVPADTSMTPDNLAVFSEGQIVPFSAVAGPTKRGASIGAADVPLIRGRDGKIVTRAQYEADSAIAALRTTEPPRPVAERLTVQAPSMPTPATQQLPLVTPPSIPLPATQQQPIADLSNAIRRATVAIDQGAVLGVPLGGDVTQQQLNLLNYFVQRDGEQYVTQVLQSAGPLTSEGKVSFEAANEAIQQLIKAGADGRMKASPDQLSYLSWHGATDEELRQASQMSFQDAHAFTSAFLGQRPIPNVNTDSFLSVADFLEQAKTSKSLAVRQMPATFDPVTKKMRLEEELRVLQERDAIEAYRRGQKYGHDYLQEILDGVVDGRSKRDPGYVFNEHNIDPSPMQTRTLLSLQDMATKGDTRFAFLKGVDLTKVSAYRAHELLTQALGDPILAAMRGVVDVPLHPVTPAEIRDATRTAEVIKAKDSAGDYIAKMTPRVGEGENERGFPTVAQAEGFGSTRVGGQRVAEGGVPLLSPFAVQSLFLKELDQHAGTIFEGPMHDAIGPYIYVKQGGEPSLTSAEITFNRAMEGLADAARQNPDTTETQRFMTMLQNAYHSDGSVPVAEDTAKKATLDAMDGQKRQQVESTVALYRLQGPAQQEELARLRSMQALATAGSATYDRLGQRIDFLSQQLGEMQTYLGKHDMVGTRLLSGSNPKMDALNARIDRYRATFTDLPAMPDIKDTSDEAMRVASTLDSFDAAQQGHLVVHPDTEPFTLAPKEPWQQTRAEYNQSRTIPGFVGQTQGNMRNLAGRNPRLADLVTVAARKQMAASQFEASLSAADRALLADWGGAQQFFRTVRSDQGLDFYATAGYNKWGQKTSALEDAHYVAVSDALKRGESVPARVLADYPDLTPTGIDPRWAPMERQRSAGRTDSFIKLPMADRDALHSQLRDNLNQVKKPAFFDVDTAQFLEHRPSVQGDMELIRDFVGFAEEGEPLDPGVAAAFERVYGQPATDTAQVADIHNRWSDRAWDDHFSPPTAFKPEPDDLAYNKAGTPLTYGDLRDEYQQIYRDARQKMESIPYASKRATGKSEVADFFTQAQRKRVNEISSQMSAASARFGGSENIPDDLQIFKWDRAYPQSPEGYTHSGLPVLTNPQRKMLVPLDARLVGKERARVSAELGKTLGELGVPDAHVAATQALVDRFAIAATENNPDRFSSPDEFYRRMHVLRGKDGLTFQVEGSGHELHYPGETSVPYAGSFTGRASGGGIIQMFSGQSPSYTFQTFLHEFGHLAMSVLTEEQLTDLSRLVGAADSEFTPQHLEGIAQSFAAWAGTDADAIKADLIAQNPAAQSIFRQWRSVLADTWQSVKQYFGQQDISREMARFWDQTFAGGSGMYAGGTYTSRSARAVMTRQASGRILKPGNIVDPLRSAGKFVAGRWDELSPKLDSYVQHFYNNDALLDDQRRFMLGGKVINPKALSDMSQVVQVGDMSSFILHTLMDGEAGRLLKPDGNLDYEALREFIATVADPANTLDKLATMPGYEHLTSSKAMLEATRIMKAHGPEVLGKFESLIPHQSMGDLIPQGIFPQPTNGRWSKAQLKEVDKIINGGKNPDGWIAMGTEDRRALRDFRDAYRDIWNDKIRGQYFVNGEWNATDPTLYSHRDAMQATLDQAQADVNLLTKRFEDYDLNTKRGVTGRARTAVETAELRRLEITKNQAARDLQTHARNLKNASDELKANDGLHIFNSIDPHVFAHDPNTTIDLAKMADHLGSAFGQAHGTAIGFDPQSLPLGMRSALFFKGQLTPLWMTLWPQYHINNLAGNWMAQLIGAMRSDIKVNALPFKNQRVQGLVDRSETGWHELAYQRADFTRGASADVGRYRAAAGLERGQVQRALPKFLDYVSGGFRGEGKRGAVTFSGDVANAVEDHFKTVAITQSSGWHMVHRWNAELSDLEKANTITKEARLALSPNMGLDEMRQTAATLGLSDEATNSVLAAGRASIANGQLQGYNDARTMLRDYRYRNKLDGMLDRFLPVHYWSTKNFAFMTRSAIDRPAMAIGAAMAYDAWQKENEHLPPSLRTGYLSVPFDHPALSWIPGVTNKTWHMRLTNLTNPVLFAVPRMLGRWDWHGEDQSIWQRTLHIAEDGMKNFWEASGYRVGPTYDMATVVGNAWKTQVDKGRLPGGPDAFNGLANTLLTGANFLTSPGLDRNLNITEGYRPGVLGSIPLLSDLGGLPMRSVKMQLLGEMLNKQVYGSAYTINETQQLSFSILGDEQNGKIDHDTAQRLVQALWKGSLDEPGLRPYIDNFWGGRSNAYLLARGLAVSGETYTDTWRQQYQGLQQFYDTKAAGELAYDDWNQLSTFAPATRYLIEQYRSGAVKPDAFQQAINDARDGKANPLLQRAWQQTQGLDAQVTGDIAFWHKMATDIQAYQKKANQAGYAAADLWAYGWKNTNTGQIQDALAPWIATYFMAIKKDRDAAAAAIAYSDQRAISDAAYALSDDYYAAKSDKSNAAAPYYAKLDLLRADLDAKQKIATEQGYDEADANGTMVRHPNMILWDEATRANKKAVQAVYDQADAAGVPMTGGTFPRHGQTLYESLGDKSMAIQVPGTNDVEYLRGGARNTDWRHTLINQNDALGAVDTYETKQAQEHWLLQRLKNSIAPSLWTDTGDPNPDYKVVDKNGTSWHFDMAAYERDRQAAADVAPQKSFELVRQLRNNDANVTVAGITRDQFLDYTADKDPALTKWQETKSKAIDAAFAMPEGWDDQGTYHQDWADARTKAFDDLKTKYGDGVLDKDYRGTANADVIYNQGGQAIRTYYQSLTPAEKDAFKKRYGSAFVTKGTSDTFDPKSLSYEQVKEILSQQNIDIFGERNTRIEIANGQIPPYTMNRVAQQAAQQSVADRIGALQTAYYNGAGLTAEQIDHNTQWHSFLDTNSPLEQQAQDLRGPDGDSQLTWAEALDAAKKRDGDNSPLAQYITARIQTSKTLDTTGIYQAQTDWWHGLDQETRQLLMKEAPKTFGQYSTQPTDEIYSLIKQYQAGAGLTAEQKSNIDAWQQFKQDHANFEKAANDLRGSFTANQLSWKATIRKAQDQGMYDLADYITLRTTTVANLNVGAAYDAQAAWWASLTPDQQAALVKADAFDFQKYADGTFTSSSFTSTGGTPSSSSGGSSKAYVPYAKKTTTAKAATGFSTTTKKSTSAAGTTGAAAAASTATVDLVRGLDPFFASGEDDGRGQTAQSVSDWIDGQIFANFNIGKAGGPLDFIYSFLRSQMLHFAMQYLGPQPTAWDWQQLLNRLTQGGHYLRQPAPPTPPPTAAAPEPPAPAPEPVAAAASLPPGTLPEPAFVGSPSHQGQRRE